MPDAIDSSGNAPSRDTAIGSGRLVALPRPPERSPGNLPLGLTSFVGREREVAEIEKLLAGQRLLTLTGPGGCGKMRLALEVSRDLVGRFIDVWLVELVMRERDGGARYGLLETVRHQGLPCEETYPLQDSTGD